MTLVVLKSNNSNNLFTIVFRIPRLLDRARPTVQRTKGDQGKTTKPQVPSAWFSGSASQTAPYARRVSRRVTRFEQRHIFADQLVSPTTLSKTQSAAPPLNPEAHQNPKRRTSTTSSLNRPGTRPTQATPKPTDPTDRTQKTLDTLVREPMQSCTTKFVIGPF